MKNLHIKKNSKAFFEGWYFKHQAFGKTISFIPGIHIPKAGKAFAFIQVISDDQSYFIKYPYDQFYARKDQLYVQIGNNIFSKNGIVIDIKTANLRLKGKLCYGYFTPIKYNIMGPFSLIPHMECHHGIISLNHPIHGSLRVNNDIISFKNGRGYIEKDWGSSFPRSYTWLQCNAFEDSTSIVISTAHIPFCGLSFEGLIAIVYYKGKEYRFATYNGGQIVFKSQKQIILKKGSYYLKATINEANSYPLQAPYLGHMSRTIYERPSCPATFEFYKAGKKIFIKSSDYTSFEYVGNKS